MRDQRDQALEIQKAKMKAIEGNVAVAESKIKNLTRHVEGLKKTLEAMQPKLDRLQAERDELSHQIETWDGKE